MVIFRCSYGTVNSTENGYNYERANDGAIFDIGNNWAGNGHSYVSTKTKKKILEIAEKKANTYNRKEIRDFINWYESLDSHVHYVVEDMSTFASSVANDCASSQSSTNYASHSSSREDSQVMLDILNEMKKQTSALEMRDSIYKVIEERTVDVANSLCQRVDDYLKSEYGNVPKIIEVHSPNGVSTTFSGAIHKDFEKILNLVNLSIPVLLVGPAGCGKNFVLEKCAESLGLDFYFTNAVTQEYKLTGFIDANGVYQETQFYKAFKNGGLFFLDEMDASIPEALIILNAAIANGYFDFPNGKITAHPDFRVVAAANTFGYGADMMYVGRNQLDAATLDRFIIFNMDYDTDLELTKCPDKDLYNFILDIRRIVKDLELRYTISTRMMINAYKMLSNGIDNDTIVKSAILKGMANDDICQIKFTLHIIWCNFCFTTFGKVCCRHSKS